MINTKVKKLLNITDEEYEKWCRDNKKNKNSKDTKTEFFKRIQKDMLIRDENKNIVRNKYIRKTKNEN